MKESWLDKHQMKIFWFTWGLVIACCIFIFFSNTVHASTGTNTEIPYNVAEWSNYNQMMLDRVDIAIQQYKTSFPSNADKPLLIWTTDGFYNGTWFQYHIMPEPYFDSNITDNFDFNSNTIRFKTHSEVVTIIVGVNGNIGGTLLPHDYMADLLGNSASVNTSMGAYLPRYPFYYDGDPIKSTNDLEVLISRVSSGPGYSGHATGPINDPDNIIKDDQNNPIIYRPNKPTPTPFTPQPFNPPSIDTSTLETLVESLIDVVEYGFNYIGGVISGAFSNLLSNLGAWVDYIVESFSYGFNNVVRAIQNLATDFYNNMVSLFEPLLNGITEMVSGIKDRIDYFFEEFDSAGAIDYYENNCSFYTLSTMSFGFISDLHTGFSGVQAPQRLVFHIDFSNAPFPFNTVGTLDINFDWYEGLRNTIVPWILVFLYFGVLYSFVMQIPNIIHGTSGLFSPHLTETNTITAIETSSGNGFNYTDSYSTVVKSYSSIFGSFSRATSSNSSVSRRKK